MGRMKIEGGFPLLLVALLLFFLSFTSMVLPAMAALEIYACDANGVEKNSFYTNDTVYACGNNLTLGVSRYVDIYIVNDTGSWPENTSLVDVSVGYQTFATNSTGDLPASSRWLNPWEGLYDMVADVDRSGKYNTTDYVDSLGSVGFTVALQPQPTLKFELGSHSPSAHDWNLAVNKSGNIMMYLKVTASNIEDVTLNWISLTSSGSGDDKTGVKYVRLVKDAEGDGILNFTDSLIAYNSYLRDNGVVMLTISSGTSVYAGNSSYFFISYVMSDTAEVGDTFKFQISAVGAAGSTTGTAARTTGLPLDSEITSITGTAAGSATTTTAASATTTTAASETTTTSTLISSEGLNYAMIIGLFAVVIIIILVAVYLLFKEKETYTFEEEK